MTAIKDEISFESDDHDPSSNGDGAAGSISVTMSEDNVSIGYILILLYNISISKTGKYNNTILLY
jgi:hypothetical protein